MKIYGKFGRNERTTEKIGKGLPYFRHIQMAYSRVASYMPGRYGNGTLTNVALPINNIFVSPFFMPPRGGRIGTICVRPNAASASNSGLFGIYENIGRGTIYPGDLIYMGPPYRVTAANFSDRPNVLLDPSKLYWFAHYTNANAAYRTMAPTINMSLGYSNSDLRNDIGGFIYPRTFDSGLPNPFPSGASPWLSNIPGIYLEFFD